MAKGAHAIDVGQQKIWEEVRELEERIERLEKSLKMPRRHNATKGSQSKK